MKHLVVCVVLLACTTKQKAELTEDALDDAGRRHTIFETTLKALDGHPEYVDEFYNMALKHKTMDSFLTSTSRGLSDEAFAHRVAASLAAHPPGLRMVMVQTIEASKAKPEARRAIVQAVDQEADLTAAFLVEAPQTLATVMKALVGQLKDHPDTAGTIKKVVADFVKG